MEAVCKIAIIENYALFSSGIRSLMLACDKIEVITDGASPEVLSLHLGKTVPDLILFDMIHCHDTGIAVLKKIGEYFPNVPVLMITSPNYSDCFKEYLKYGSKGFIFTGDNPKELITAVKTLCLGNLYFKGNVLNQFLVSLPPSVKKKGRPRKDNPLTKREIDVLKLFCDGLTYREIGSKLQISERTVETHKKHIMYKLKVTTRAEMIKYATRNNYTTS